MPNEPGTIKEPFLNENTSLLDKAKKLTNSNNLQHTDLHQSSSSIAILNSVKNSDFQTLLPEKSKTVPLNNTKPSCSHDKDNLVTSIKIESDITNNTFSQGTYRKEEDSIIIIYSSDEENNVISHNDLKVPNVIIEQQEHINLNASSMRNSNPSSSKVENNKILQEWPIHCQRNEFVSDDDDDIIYMQSFKLDSKNINNDLKISSDSDSDCGIKFPKIIEPLPIPIKKRGQAKNLIENENIIKTRARSEKMINNKKKTGEIIVDQNKEIVQKRRLRLQQLAKNNSTSLLPEKKILNESDADEPSTMNKLKKKTRISRLQQNDNNCLPSTSKSYLTTKVEKIDTLDIEKKVKFKTDKQISHTTRFVNPLFYIYFNTISKICKWNALWLHVS